MPTLGQIKEAVKKSMVDNMEMAFSRVEVLLSSKSKLSKELSIVKRRYKSIQKRMEKGSLSYEKAALETNKIRNDLLIKIVDKLEASDLRPGVELISEELPDSNASTSLVKARSNELQLIPREAARLFRARFRLLQDSGVQHYFLQGSKDFNPDNYVEQMIFDLQAGSDRIIYESKTGKEVLIKPFQLGGNLEISQLRFCEYFSQRFDTNLSSLKDMVSVLGTDTTYRYVVTTLQFSEQDWKDYTVDFFTWLIEEFSITSPLLPTKFLFFHILPDVSSASRRWNILGKLFGFGPGKEKVNRQIIQTASRYSNCTLFPNLSGMNRKELTVWLQEYVGNKGLINKLTNQLSAPKQLVQKSDITPAEDKFAEIIED